MGKLCSNCGTLVADDKVFCDRCGAPLPQQPQAMQNQYPQAPGAPQQGWGQQPPPQQQFPQPPGAPPQQQPPQQFPQPPGAPPHGMSPQQPPQQQIPQPSGAPPQGMSPQQPPPQQQFQQPPGAPPQGVNPQQPPPQQQFPQPPGAPPQGMSPQQPPPQQQFQQPPGAPPHGMNLQQPPPQQQFPQHPGVPQQSGFPQASQFPPHQGPAQYGMPLQGAPQKKSRKLLVIILVIVAVIAAGVVTAILVTGNTSKKDFIKIGKDEVPSVKYIIGEVRNVTGVNSSIENGVSKKVITYSVLENQREEMLKYAQALYDNYHFWYYETNEDDFSGSEGIDLRLAKESVEEDFIIIVRIDYDRSGYTITLTRVRGTLTVNE